MASGKGRALAAAVPAVAAGPGGTFLIVTAGIDSCTGAVAQRMGAQGSAVNGCRSRFGLRHARTADGYPGT